MTCSAGSGSFDISYGPGVADMKTDWCMRDSNSSKLRGRLSRAEGSLKPCSTSVSLRERSPLYMPLNWGMVECDSSMKKRESSGKKSTRQWGRSPGRRPLRWRE